MIWTIVRFYSLSYEEVMRLKLARLYEAWDNIVPIRSNEIEAYGLLAALPMAGTEGQKQFYQIIDEAQLTSKQRKEMRRLRDKYVNIHFPARKK